MDVVWTSKRRRVLGYYSLFTTFKRKNKKNLEKRCFIKISENIFHLNKYTMFLLTVCFWKKKTGKRFAQDENVS